MTNVLSVPPPSRAHLYVQFAPGHWVFYRDVSEAIQRMEARRQRWAHEEGIEHLEIGETLDLFGGVQ